MKVFWTLIVAGLLVGCDLPSGPSRVSKVIIDKQAPTESRLDWVVEGLRSRPITVYYLIAEDGTVAEVGLSAYSKTKIGETYASTVWSIK